MRWLVTHIDVPHVGPGNTLRVGVSADGLHLSLDWFASWNTPPLCIPWREVLLCERTVSIASTLQSAEPLTYGILCPDAFAEIQRTATHANAARS